MKISPQIFSIIILLLSPWYTLHAQSGTFTWQNPSPQGNTLINICLVTDSFFVAVGEMGTIIRSTDQGATWVVTPTVLGCSATLRSVDFVSPTEGWVAGDSATILHTTDGGNTWSRNLPIDGSFMVQDIQFLNSMVGWACGISESGFLWKTTDGGANWTTIEDFDAPFQQIMYLKDSTVMLLATDGEIQISLDSGKTWLFDGREVMIDAPLEMCVIDPNGTIWQVSEGIILRSTDGGFNWEERGPQDVPATSIFFTDGAHGWAASNNVGEIYVTTDSGATWKQDTIFNSATSFTTMNRIRMRSSGVGMVAGVYGLMATTKDFGVAWQPQGTDNGNYIPNIQFLSPLEGWAAGGRLRHTTDGGNVWTASSQIYRANAITFSSPQNGWFGTDVGVWRTTNAGTDWNKCYSFGYTLCLTAFDSLNVWRGTYSDLEHSTDAGNSWTTVLNHSVSSLQFLNADTGWVVNYSWSNDSSIFRTTDGGKSWQSAQVGDVVSVRFVSPSTGCAGGTSGRIWKTTDGGVTWLLKHGPTPGNWYMHGISFSSPLLGWAVGYIGNGLGDYILRTTDGGETWNEIPSISNNGLFSVCFINDSTGFIGGLDGEMLRIDYPPGIPDGVKETGQAIPLKFSLAQNYPNPFNPATQISFTINSPSVVTLKVFDILGREVATLVNGFKQPRAYSINWDGSRMSSGVYFYRLCEEPTAGKGTFQESVKKMILMK